MGMVNCIAPPIHVESSKAKQSKFKYVECSEAERILSLQPKLGDIAEDYLQSSALEAATEADFYTFNYNGYDVSFGQGMEEYQVIRLFSVDIYRNDIRYSFWYREIG